MGERLYDLKYADDIVYLYNTGESAQLALDNLRRAVTAFGTYFTLSKCKMMYQDWDSPESPLTPNGVCPEVIDRFTYLSSCVSDDGGIG